MIPILCREGAPQAARHAAFLFAERCVSEVELIEVLEQADQGRAAAFYSRGELRRREKRLMLEALMRTRAILDDAGVPYTFKRVFGPRERTIAEHAANDQADMVVLDGTSLGFFRRWGTFARLWRVCSKPVTMIH
ncbi:nucleotide-binding universal stress UspA family protein [Trinickia symbiotica]|nr:nucleotide-binding universal stress UspA family protein [Trinickia symbiotica]